MTISKQIDNLQEIPGLVKFSFNKGLIKIDSLYNPNTAQKILNKIGLGHWAIEKVELEYSKNIPF